jgi:hypothetical protein
LTCRRWRRWRVARKDGKMNRVWWLRQIRWSRDRGWMNDARRQMESLALAPGEEPDLEAVAECFRPPITHDVVPDRDDETRVSRIVVDGVTVRYVDDGVAITITVEGSLPAKTCEQVVADLVRKLDRIEGVPCGGREL